TRFDGRADDAAHVLAKLGGRVGGDQVEFLDGVRRRGKAHQIVGYLIVVHAIKKEVVGLFAIAVDVRPSAGGGVVAVVEVGRIRADATRRQQRKFNVVARRK